MIPEMLTLSECVLNNGLVECIYMGTIRTSQRVTTDDKQVVIYENNRMIR